MKHYSMTKKADPAGQFKGVYYSITESGRQFTSSTLGETVFYTYDSDVFETLLQYFFDKDWLVEVSDERMVQILNEAVHKFITKRIFHL